MYIASCEDLQIRVYSPNFEVLQGVPMPSSVLCLLYLEESDELLAGGVGQLHTWDFHPRQKNMLTKASSFMTTIKPQQVLSCSCSNMNCIELCTGQNAITYQMYALLATVNECARSEADLDILCVY